MAGFDVATGDFNEDTIDDLLIGSPNARNYAGVAYVIFGTQTLAGSKDLAVGAGFVVLGGEQDAFLGYSVAAGDFNNDGIDDMLLGAPGSAAVGNGAGQVTRSWIPGLKRLVWT